MNYRTDWIYEGLDAGRAARLSASPDYAKIIQHIVDQIDPEKIEFHIDRGRYEPADDALRPLFYMEVSEELGDLFFNGVTGYRAQYYLSAANGLSANACALLILTPHLLACACNNGFSFPDPNCPGKQLTMTAAEINQTLQMSSAKIWGDETEPSLSEIVKSIQNATPQIVAKRWVDAAKNGEQKAMKGIKAPPLCRIKVHGGFLKDGAEKIPVNKKHRSEDIYNFGFS